MLIKNRFNKWMDKYHHLKLRNKIMLLNSITIVSIVILLGSFVSFLYQKTILDQMSAFALTDTIQVADNIEFIQHDLEDLSNYITTDNTLQRLVKTSHDKLNESNEDLDDIESMLSNFLIAKDYLDFVGIYSNNGVNYYASTDGSNTTVHYADFKQTTLYKLTHGQKGAPFWSYLPKTDDTYITDNKADKLTLSKSILSLSDYTSKAYLNLSINTSSLKPMFEEILLVEDSMVMIMDQDNNILLEDSAANTSLPSIELPETLINRTKTVDSGTEIIELKGVKLHITFTNLENGDLILFYIVPISNMIPNTLNIQLFIGMILIIVFIIGLIFTSYISSHLTKPTLELLDAMSAVDEDQLEQYVDVKYYDEIGDLAVTYNKMIQKIDALINQVYKLEIEEKAAELKALQAQINPHFLYNTLDTIYWKAVANDNVTVQNMIQSLSKLFRLTLNSGNEINHVFNEETLIHHYMTLQEMRFKNKLKHVIDIDDSMSQYELPKLILQPFVENAIIHGMETEDKVTTIIIKGLVTEDNLCFTIEDNGSGMSQETLAKILNPTIKQVPVEPMDIMKKSGYGIKNVMNRLALYYENNYTLTITSEIGKGTTVTIIVPTKISVHLKKEKSHVQNDLD